MKIEEIGEERIRDSETFAEFKISREKKVKEAIETFISGVKYVSGYSKYKWEHQK